MTRYQIAANGTDMGIYEARSEDEAILKYINDAGYSTLQDAAEACNQTVDEFLDDIDISDADAEDDDEVAA